MPDVTYINKSRSKPSLEFCSDRTNRPRRVTVDKSPFRIGRAETSDLRINSGQVSREHAELLNRGGVWFVRDLASTNGTLVNGKRVSETLLVDGDVLRVAEMELRFNASPTSQFQRMVTHPVYVRAPRPAALPILPAEILSARALAEATLLQAIPLSLQTVVSHSDRTVEAVFASLAVEEGQNVVEDFFRSGHVAAARYRQLYRRRAIEVALERAAAQRVFVLVDVVELGSHAKLQLEFDDLEERLPSDWELGVVLSSLSILERRAMDVLYPEIRDRGILLAYNNFHGNGSQVIQLAACAPDYLLLAESMAEGVLESSESLLRIESVSAACEELGIKPVLPRCDGKSSLKKCVQAGYDLSIGNAALTSKSHSAPPAAHLPLAPTR